MQTQLAYLMREPPTVPYRYQTCMRVERNNIPTVSRAYQPWHQLIYQPHVCVALCAKHIFPHFRSTWYRGQWTHEKLRSCFFTRNTQQRCERKRKRCIRTINITLSTYNARTNILKNLPRTDNFTPRCPHFSRTSLPRPFAVWRVRSIGGMLSLIYRRREQIVIGGKTPGFETIESMLETRIDCVGSDFYFTIVKR